MIRGIVFGSQTGHFHHKCGKCAPGRIPRVTPGDLEPTFSEHLVFLIFWIAFCCIWFHIVSMFAAVGSILHAFGSLLESMLLRLAPF